MESLLELDAKLAVWISLTGAVDPGLQRVAPRCGTLGKARQRVGEALALALDVEHVAVARRVAPGRLLPGAQAPPGMGDGVVGPQPPLGDVEQVHAPGVGVATVLRGQEIAVRRCRIDAGQHWRGARRWCTIRVMGTERWL